jgi:hypothetical protein
MIHDPVTSVGSRFELRIEFMSGLDGVGSSLSFFLFFFLFDRRGAEEARRATKPEVVRSKRTAGSPRPQDPLPV